MLKSNNLQTVHYYTHLDSYELHNIATTLTLFVMHPYSAAVLVLDRWPSNLPSQNPYAQ